MFTYSSAVVEEWTVELEACFSRGRGSTYRVISEAPPLSSSISNAIAIPDTVVIPGYVGYLTPNADFDKYKIRLFF